MRSKAEILRETGRVSLESEEDKHFEETASEDQVPPFLSIYGPLMKEGLGWRKARREH